MDEGCTLALAVLLGKPLGYHAYFVSAAKILKHPHGHWQIGHALVRSAMGIVTLLVAVWFASALRSPAVAVVILWGIRVVAWSATGTMLREELRTRRVSLVAVVLCGLAVNLAFDVALIATSPWLRETLQLGALL